VAIFELTQCSTAYGTYNEWWEPTLLSPLLRIDRSSSGRQLNFASEVDRRPDSTGFRITAGIEDIGV